MAKPCTEGLHPVNIGVHHILYMWLDCCHADYCTYILSISSIQYLTIYLLLTKINHNHDTASNVAALEGWIIAQSGGHSYALPHAYLTVS